MQYNTGTFDTGIINFILAYVQANVEDRRDWWVLQILCCNNNIHRTLMTHFLARCTAAGERAATIACIVLETSQHFAPPSTTNFWKVAVSYLRYPKLVLQTRWVILHDVV